MAKVSDYKVTKVVVGDVDTAQHKLEEVKKTTVLCNLNSKPSLVKQFDYAGDNLIDVLSKVIKKKEKCGVYAVFTLKRRQTIETWVNQIQKYLYANSDKLGIFTDTYEDFVKELGATFNTYVDEATDEVLVEVRSWQF